MTPLLPHKPLTMRQIEIRDTVRRLRSEAGTDPSLTAVSRIVRTAAHGHVKRVIEKLKAQGEL